MNDHNRRQLLDSGWRLKTDPRNTGREGSWFEAVPVDAAEAQVPGIIQQTFPCYSGVAWYWNTLRADVTIGPRDRCLLSFGAVDYLADVWLNGQHIGCHEGGETPFVLDGTSAFRRDEPNLLAVRVLNPRDEPIDGFALAEVPRRFKYENGYMPSQMCNFGGIIEPVELVAAPEVRVTDVWVRADADTGSVRVNVEVENDSGAPLVADLAAFVCPHGNGALLVSSCAAAHCDRGTSKHELTLSVSRPKLWSLDDPFLYSLRVEISARDLRDERSVRFGFRDFRVRNGFFYLNGKRVLLKSTHTLNHVPIGVVVPQNSDFLRRDLVFAKACGFNMVRFIAGTAYPWQLDLCDELGLMVYEEAQGSWLLEDSPWLGERYDRAYTQMILRDRNHPSVVIWGLLNETNSPAFAHAVGTLPLVRSLDPTRLVLLNSGRYDRNPTIGSYSNPDSLDWEFGWGQEGKISECWVDYVDTNNPAGSTALGDIHTYPACPYPLQTHQFFRSLGRDSGPVFLSEFGVGSLNNAIGSLRKYEEAGARADLRDFALYRSMAEQFEADWHRFGMQGVYPFPEDMLLDSERLHVRQRALIFDLVRSNPNLCGVNITGMLDHVMCGEGLWSFWRELKSGIADTLREGWAPLRWCLFAYPLHRYRDEAIQIEAVLANEGVLAPGDYPATFRIAGRSGNVWETHNAITIPEPDPGCEVPLAAQVLLDEVLLDAPAGDYVFAANMDRGGAPSGGRLRFRLADRAELPVLNTTVVTWGIAADVEQWLASQGVRCLPFGEARARESMVLLVGEPEAAAIEDWHALAKLIASGSVAVFLSPKALASGKETAFWLPLETKGECRPFNDWLYHKECVGKVHPVFDGLQTGGILDWDYYEQTIPRYILQGQDTPDDVAAAAFAVGYSCPGGYASGVVIGAYKFGAGAFVVSTMRILEHVGRHPAADRLLLNLITHAVQQAQLGPETLPEDFSEWLRRYYTPQVDT